jgi:hypothetical protein
VTTVDHQTALGRRLHPNAQPAYAFDHGLSHTGVQEIANAARPIGQRTED